jgi:single-strand DNA-binding protein
MTLPKMTFVGNAVSDPELKFTPSGKAVCKLRVVANARVRGSNGEWSDGDPTFLTVEAWQKLAENICESITKGTQVIAEGTLEVREYEKSDGTRGTAVTLKADAVGVGLQFRSARPDAVVRSDAPADQAGVDPWATGPSDDAPPF